MSETLGAQSLCRVVVLISGSGSNLQTLIDGQLAGTLPISIEAVISNREGAFGLKRADKHKIPNHVLAHKNFADRGSFDKDLSRLIDDYQPALVILAGFMRILTPEFVRHYTGRMLNIHPSLLPKYQGLHTHQRALDSNDVIHGVSVHFVTEELDGGPTIIQALVPILKDDDVESLQMRVQAQEHIIYPMAITWFAEQRLTIKSDIVLLDNEPLAKAGYQIDSRTS
ncbi:MAG: phosphoribosylglycinamide formyltransferase-1 [Pseudohongiellaceae bacterium]|jgi:phosphoribosylglycinamide formyltransferase-1